MIKFFRRIRQQLLSENKVSKYLVYAIGEIVLVVIGILLALSINNWNNGQKARDDERTLLINLKEEFTENMNQLRSDHDINVRTLETSYDFLEIKSQLSSPREIDSMVGQLMVFASFDPSIGYIEQAINSGRLDLLQNETLKKLLGDWTGELSDLMEDNIIRREHWVHYLLPVVRKHLPIRNTDFWHHRPDYQRTRQVSPLMPSLENYTAFTQSLEVDGVIYDHYMNQYYVSINEEHLEQYMQQILDLIDRELE